jgi:Archaeal holliday junction resolvase (hjc)
MLRAKKKGARRERQAMVQLESAGYYVVRSGGSLGLFDLVAIGPSSVKLIQCKSNRKPGARERAALAAFPVFPYCTREIWIFHDKTWEPVIEVVGEVGEEEMET